MGPEILKGDGDTDLFCVKKNPESMGSTLVWNAENGAHGAGARPGPPLLPEEPLATSPPEELATSPPKEADVDCIVGKWSAFSKCDTKCGPGIQLRYRTLTQPSGN